MAYCFFSFWCEEDEDEEDDWENIGEMVLVGREKAVTSATMAGELGWSR
jgi:hypothetical protein